MTIHDQNLLTIRAFSAYLLEEKADPKVIEEKVRYLTNISGFLITTFEDADSREICETLAAVRAKRRWSKSTQRNAKTALHRLYDWLMKSGLVSSDPVPYGKGSPGRKGKTIAMREFIADCYTGKPEQMIHYRSKAYSLTAVLAIYTMVSVPGALNRMIFISDTDQKRAVFGADQIRSSLGSDFGMFTEAELQEFMEAYRRGGYRVELMESEE